MKPKQVKSITRHDAAMANRLTEFRKKYVSDNMVEAARLLNVPLSSYSYMESATRPIRLSVIKDLENSYGMNPRWLTHGERPMVKGDKNKTNVVLDVKTLNDRIDMLSKQVEILNLSLTNAWKIIERQGEEMERQSKELSGRQ